MLSPASTVSVHTDKVHIEIKQKLNKTRVFTTFLIDNYSHLLFTEIIKMYEVCFNMSKHIFGVKLHIFERQVPSSYF